MHCGLDQGGMQFLQAAAMRGGEILVVEAGEVVWLHVAVLQQVEQHVEVGTGLDWVAGDAMAGALR